MNTQTAALNPAAIVALQFEQEMYEMLRRAGVSEARIDAMRATAVPLSRFGNDAVCPAMMA